LGKPIQETIFKSRLTITYRTNITGTVKQEPLPFRLLVLGNFSGDAIHEGGLLPRLEERDIRTIKRGMTVNHYLGEILPMVKVTNSALATKIPGKLVNVAIPVDLTDEQLAPAKAPAGGGDPPARTVRVKLKGGKGKWQSTTADNGLCPVECDVEIAGDLELEITSVSGAKTVATKGVELFLKGRPLGTLMDSTTGERLMPVTGLLPEGALVVAYAAADASATPPTEETITWDTAPTAGGSYTLKIADRPQDVDRTIPFDSMEAFRPDRVAVSVPEILRLLTVRSLVQELLAELRNSPDLRAAVKKSLTEQTGLVALQQWAAEQYWLLRLEKPQKSTGAAFVLPAEGVKTRDELLHAIGAAPESLVDKADSHTLALVEQEDNKPLSFHVRDANFPAGARFMNAFAALLVNGTLENSKILSRTLTYPDGSTEKKYLDTYSELLAAANEYSSKADALVRGHLDTVFHDGSFQGLEANWRSLHDLASSVTASDVLVDFLDVTGIPAPAPEGSPPAPKGELQADFEDNGDDIFSSALFKKVYIEEYDRYGGKPFSAMIGLYEFGADDDAMQWLNVMGKIANAAHCPFVSSVSPRFFKGCKTMEDVAQIADLDAVLSNPVYSKWSALRDRDWACYIGLAVPRYIVRQPWGHSGNAEQGNSIRYAETVDPKKVSGNNFLWGNAAMLFAKNMVRSYENSGWAQHIRGPLGGGIVEGLDAYVYTDFDREEVKPSVEIAIPDYRELQFANNGFIPLVQKKNDSVATFFSSQSIKKPKFFVEDVATKNAHLVTNLSYTLSITRIAHYVKKMVREYIGSTADADYMQRMLGEWIGSYVTTVVNPDDLTLLYYPFKATEVTVEPKPGPFGWYKATISVLPHVQFEGMDVELRLEAALGGK